MRDRWLRALRDAVPRLELALGARINCTDVEYREHAGAFLATSGCAANEALDLLAAFATDACLLERSDIVEPTPSCFIKGSGQQFFLDTVRQLIGEGEANVLHVRPDAARSRDHRMVDRRRRAGVHLADLGMKAQDAQEP